MNYTTQEESCASITTNKNRVKTYGNNVYLKDKQEFEIELFNPSTVTRKAMISINGTLISSSGLVIKPGQRIYLERFLDSPKKFKFETYEVNGASAAVQQAIQKNGDVEITFYDEYVRQPIYYRTNTFHFNNNDWYNGGVTNVSTLTSSGDSEYGNLRSMNAMFCSTANTDDLAQKYKSSPLRKASLSAEKRETGRVEEGSSSNQNFTNYSGQFNSWASKTVRIKILPLSEKPLENKDLASYCTECGAKNKGGKYKFCPSCGHKF